MGLPIAQPGCGVFHFPVRGALRSTPGLLSSIPSSCSGVSFQTKNPGSHEPGLQKALTCNWAPIAYLGRPWQKRRKPHIRLWAYRFPRGLYDGQNLTTLPLSPGLAPVTCDGKPDFMDSSFLRIAWACVLSCVWLAHGQSNAWPQFVGPRRDAA